MALDFEDWYKENERRFRCGHFDEYQIAASAYEAGVNSSKIGSGLNLKELEEKLDAALEKETAESLTKWLKEKRNIDPGQLDWIEGEAQEWDESNTVDEVIDLALFHQSDIKLVDKHELRGGIAMCMHAWHNKQLQKMSIEDFINAKIWLTKK